jgi:hypothetical protein
MSVTPDSISQHKPKRSDHYVRTHAILTTVALVLLWGTSYFTSSLAAARGYGNSIPFGIAMWWTIFVVITEPLIVKFTMNARPSVRDISVIFPIAMLLLFGADAFLTVLGNYVAFI